MNSNSVRHINFLESAPGARSALVLNYFWMLAIILSFAVGAGIYAYLQNNRIKSMRTQLAEINANLVRLKEMRSKEEMNSLSGKALKEVLNNPMVWSGLVNQIIKKIPDSILLKEISGGILDKRTLVIRGRSPFLLPIFRLKKNLSTLKECENTTLVSVEQSRGDNGEEQIAFQLECKLL